MTNPTTVSRSDPAIKAVLGATFPDYRGRLIRVQPYTGPLMWTVCWDEGSRDTIRLLDVSRGIADLRPGSPFTNPDGCLARVDQPAGSLLVVHSIVCGRDRGITIIVRQPDAGAIPAGIAGLIA
jgi:hypothetical protein